MIKLRVVNKIFTCYLWMGRTVVVIRMNKIDSQLILL